MPRVPGGYKLGEIDSAPIGTSYQSGRAATTEAFGGGVARGLQSFGRSADQATDTTFGTLQLQQAEAVEKEAKDLDNQFAEASRDLLLTGDDAYYKKKGQAAVDAFPTTQAALKKVQDDLAGKSTNPRVRKAFTEAAQGRNNQAFDGMARFSNAAADDAFNTTSEVRQSEAVDDAVAGWNDPTTLSRSLGIMDGEVQSQAQKNGWSPEVTVSKMQSARTAVYSAAINSAIAAGNPAAGRALFQKYSGQLDAKQRLALQETLTKENLQTDAFAKADEIRSKTKSMSGQLSAAAGIGDGKVRDAVETILRQSQSDTVRIYNAGRTLGAEGRLQASQKAADSVLDQTNDYSEAMALVRKNYTGEERANVENLVQSRFSEEATAIDLDQKLNFAERQKNAIEAANDLEAQGIPYEKQVETARGIEDPFQRDAVLKELNVRLSQKNTQTKALTDAAVAQAFEAVTAGQSYNDWAMKNPDAAQAVLTRPTQAAALRKAEVAAVEGRLYAPVTDGTTYAKLMTQPPEELAKVDPTQYRASMTKGEYGKLITAVKGAEASMSKDKAKGNTFAVYNQADRVLEKLAPGSLKFGQRNKTVTDKVKADQSAIRNTVYGSINELLQTKEKPTQDDIIKAVNDAVAEVEVVDEGYIYNSYEKTYAGVVKKLPPEQRATVRVPIENISEDKQSELKSIFAAPYIDTADRGRVTKPKIAPDAATMEEFMGAYYAGDVARQYKLLGIGDDETMAGTKVPAKQEEKK